MPISENISSGLESLFERSQPLGRDIELLAFEQTVLELQSDGTADREGLRAALLADTVDVLAVPLLQTVVGDKAGAVGVIVQHPELHVGVLQVVVVVAQLLEGDVHLLPSAGQTVVDARTNQVLLGDAEGLGVPEPLFGLQFCWVVVDDVGDSLVLHAVPVPEMFLPHDHHADALPFLGQQVLLDVQALLAEQVLIGVSKGSELGHILEVVDVVG